MYEKDKFCSFLASLAAASTCLHSLGSVCDVAHISDPLEVFSLDKPSSFY